MMWNLYTEMCFRCIIQSRMFTEKKKGWDQFGLISQFFLCFHASKSCFLLAGGNLSAKFTVNKNPPPVKTAQNMLPLLENKQKNGEKMSRNAAQCATDQPTRCVNVQVNARELPDFLENKKWMISNCKHYSIWLPTFLHSTPKHCNYHYPFTAEQYLT